MPGRFAQKPPGTTPRGWVYPSDTSLWLETRGQGILQRECRGIPWSQLTSMGKQRLASWYQFSFSVISFGSQRLRSGRPSARMDFQQFWEGGIIYYTLSVRDYLNNSPFETTIVWYLGANLVILSLLNCLD